jgi:tetratricopeptide (TPR) repeat protein
MNISDTVDLILNIIYAVLIIWVALKFSANALAKYAKKYQWAIGIYTVLVTINPFDATAYLNRSWAYLEVKKYQKAIRSADRVISLSTKFSRLVSKANLAMAYTNRGAANANYFKEYERAIQDFDCAIELNPNNILAYSNRGITYYNLKEYRRAIQNFDRALELNPKYPSAYFSRGNAYSCLNEYERAIDNFNYVIELDPSFACAYNNRGHAYLGLGDIQQARSDCSRSWRMNPEHIDHGWSTHWIEMCLARPGIDMAERLEKIASANPQDADAYVCRGAALWLRGSFEQSLIELEQATLLRSNDREKYFWIGMTCASLGRDHEAIGALEHSLASGLPPILLAPLRWFEQDKPEFYETYAKALLARYKGV